MVFQSLDPIVPVFIPSNGRRGYAQWVIHYGPEHHVFWGVVYDDTGEVWWHPNPEIRVQWNSSLGRNQE